MNDFLLSIAASTLRVATPLLFAALGGLLTERAGVVSLSLEGMMLAGAFGGAWAGSAFLSPWAGALGGALAGLAMGFVFAIFALKLRSHQTVAGIAVNMLALGLTPFLCKIVFGATGSSPPLPIEARFAWFPVPAAWGAVLVVWSYLRFSAGGLRLRFAGESPESLHAAGLSVPRVRWGAVLAGGALAGLGGASLSVFLSSAFSRNMSSGRGFIALAALVLGKWKPWPTAAACVLFAAADALQIQLQGVSIGDFLVPVQFIQILPYVVTLLVLGGFLGASRPPKSLGKPWDGA